MDNGAKATLSALSSPGPLTATRLHPRLAALLRRVQAAERTAVGAQRRPTFRLMREILGACLSLGVPAQLLAECLGISRDSVRNRAAGGPDGIIAADLVPWLTGSRPAQLDRFSNGRLADAAIDLNGGTTVYPTTDVIDALLRAPRRLPREKPPRPARH